MLPIIKHTQFITAKAAMNMPVCTCALTHICRNEGNRWRRQFQKFSTCKWLIILQSSCFIFRLWKREKILKYEFILLQINPTRCKILIYLFISLLYKFRASWSAGWIFNPTSRPDATHREWHAHKCHIDSDFLLTMGAWMPETCREDK